MNKTRGTLVTTPHGNPSRNGRGMMASRPQGKPAFSKQRYDHPNPQLFKDNQDKNKAQLNLASELPVDNKWNSGHDNVPKPYRNVNEQGRFRQGGGGPYQGNRQNFGGYKTRGGGYQQQAGRSQEAASTAPPVTFVVSTTNEEEAATSDCWGKTSTPVPASDDMIPKSEEEEKQMLEIATLNSLEETLTGPECDPPLATSEVKSPAEEPVAVTTRDAVKSIERPPSAESKTLTIPLLPTPDQPDAASVAPAVSDSPATPSDEPDKVTTVPVASSTSSRPKSGDGAPYAPNTRKQFFRSNKSSSYGNTDTRVSPPTVAAFSSGGSGDLKESVNKARPTRDGNDTPPITYEQGQSNGNGGAIGSSNPPPAASTGSYPDIAPRLQNGHFNRRSSNRHGAERRQSTPSVDPSVSTTAKVDRTSGDETVGGNDPAILASKLSTEREMSPAVVPLLPPPTGQSKAPTIGGQSHDEAIVPPPVHVPRQRTEINRPPVYTILQQSPQLAYQKPHLSATGGGNGLLPTPSTPSRPPQTMMQGAPPTATTPLQAASHMMMRPQEDPRDEEIRRLKSQVNFLTAQCNSQPPPNISVAEALPPYPGPGQMYGNFAYHTGLPYGTVPMQYAVGTNATAYPHQVQPMLHSYSLVRQNQQPPPQQQSVQRPPPGHSANPLGEPSTDSSGDLTNDVALRQAIIAVDKDSSHQQQLPSYPPGFNANGPPPPTSQQLSTTNGGQQWHSNNQHWHNSMAPNDSRLSATATPFSPRPPYDLPPTSLDANYYSGYPMPGLVAQQQQQVSNAVAAYQPDAAYAAFGAQRNGNRGAIDNGCYRRYDDQTMVPTTTTSYCYGTDGRSYQLVQPAYTSGAAVGGGGAGFARAPQAIDYSGFVTAPPYPGNEALYNFQQSVPLPTYDHSKPILYGAGAGRSYLPGAGRPTYQVRQRGRGRGQQHGGNGPRF